MLPVGLSLAPDLSEGAAAARRAELQDWIKEFNDWKAWSARWGGRREPGWFTGSRDRRQEPAPPGWLAGECATVFDDADPLVPACDLLVEWREQGRDEQARRARAAVLMRQEEPPKTSWWEHVNLDVLWPSLQWQNSVYGVLGMHVSTAVAGRWQVFTAPGVQLLNLPARNGTRVWKIAANYGVGYRLLDFRFPGGRPAELHLNLAKTWFVSDTTDLLGKRSLDVVGFSITFKKTR